jgi:hypothetical protein
LAWEIAPREKVYRVGRKECWIGYMMRFSMRFRSELFQIELLTLR